MLRSVTPPPTGAGTAVDATAESVAAELESMAWLNISLQMQSGGDWRSSFVLLGAPDQAVPAEPQATVQSRG